MGLALHVITTQRASVNSQLTVSSYPTDRFCGLAMFHFPRQDFAGRIATADRSPRASSSYAKQGRRRQPVAHALRYYAPVAIFLGLCTIAIRMPNFGDPTYHIDEAFYLLVGEKMSAGLVPYRDIWDRKPAGLFVLYAAIARLGSVYAYQAAAALFAWATSVVLAIVASRFTGRMAASAAGVLYLSLIGALAGGGGQSPVFYNLFIAAAALLVLDWALNDTADKSSRAGTCAMILCGLALTFKPTALPEGVFFGLVLLAIRWKRRRDAFDLIRYGAGLCLAALSPTALIWLVYAATGDFQEYWFATMQSVFLTSPDTHAAGVRRLAYLAFVLCGSSAAALIGLVVLVTKARRAGARDRFMACFVAGWVVAAVAGFLLVPNFFDHYALPLASVLAVASAPLFEHSRAGRAFGILAIAGLLLISGYPNGQLARNAAARQGYAKVSTLIADHIGAGCLIVYDATPALYRGHSMCPDFTYPFPEHLSNQREAKAIGDDPVAVLSRALAEKPAVVVVAASPSIQTPNLATRQLLLNRLASDYAKVGQAELVDVVGRQTVQVWSRRERAVVAR